MRAKLLHEMILPLYLGKSIIFGTVQCTLCTEQLPQCWDLWLWSGRNYLTIPFKLELRTGGGFGMAILDLTLQVTSNPPLQQSSGDNISFIWREGGGCFRYEKCIHWLIICALRDAVRADRIPLRWMCPWLHTGTSGQLSNWKKIEMRFAWHLVLVYAWYATRADRIYSHLLCKINMYGLPSPATEQNYSILRK